MLGLVGYPPNREQVKIFWNDPNSKKRSQKIDELLETPEYADLLTRRIMTFLFEGNYHNVPFDGIKPDLTGGAKGRIVADFHHFLSIRIAKDRPWNQIVYEILDARGDTIGDPALGYKLSFYRGDGYKAESVSGFSRHFLGIRILCAFLYAAEPAPYSQVVLR